MSAAKHDRQTCQAKTAGGKPCKMRPLQGGRFCWNHSPHVANDRAKARQLGGRNSHTPHAGNFETTPDELPTIREAAKLIRYTIDELLAMDNSIPRARALLAAATAYIEATKTGELEAQLKELLRVLELRT